MRVDQLIDIRNNGGKIAVIGIGQENSQFLEWLEVVVQFPKSQIILADRYSTNNLKKAEYAQVFEGENYLDCLQNNHVELVFKAPGIWSLLPELEDFRKRKGLNRVMSSLVFFVERFREQIIGVTGTKGKSTVSSLTNHLLNELGKDRIKSYYCGNTTNISPYQHWTKLDQSVESKTFFVIELSSFQLQDLGYAKISPKYSIITNYYTDHQDQHASIEEYWAAKNNIFLYQNVGDVFVTTQELINKINAQSFDQKLIQLSDEDIQQKIADFDFVLPGEHNQTNLALSLSMINEILETPLNNVQNSLNSYSPLPYRNQLIRTEIVVIRVNKLEKNLKINWVNDGAASEPDAVAAAVRTFGEDDYLWVQFTGKNKGGEYEKVIEAILAIQTRGNLFRVDYCGDVGGLLLKKLYDNLGIEQNIATSDFVEIVKEELGDADAVKKQFEKWINSKIDDLESIGDTNALEQIMDTDESVLNIVLSPCGTSFDIFSNYIERAEFWNENIKKAK